MYEDQQFQGLIFLRSIGIYEKISMHFGTNLTQYSGCGPVESEGESEDKDEGEREGLNETERA